MWSIDDSPEIQNVGPGGTIRWAVGRPEGPRSGTWNITTAANSRDVFIGARETLGAVKLTLHPTMWRLAHLEKYAEANLPPGQDRLIRRWPPAPEAVQGWRPALFVLVGSSLLGPPRPEKAPKRGTIAWWPDPGPGGLVSFKLLLGAPQRPPMLAGPGMYAVGTAGLSDGHQVYLLAQYGPAGEGFERSVQERRAHVAQSPSDAGPWAWSTTGEGVPSMLDTFGLVP